MFADDIVIFVKSTKTVGKKLELVEFCQEEQNEKIKCSSQHSFSSAKAMLASKELKLCEAKRGVIKRKNNDK